MAYRFADETGRCPREYPFAFMWGTHCCKHDVEDDTTYGVSECDGGPISLNSICCKNNEYKKCWDLRGCKDRRGKLHFVD